MDSRSDFDTLAVAIDSITVAIGGECELDLGGGRQHQRAGSRHGGCARGRPHLLHPAGQRAGFQRVAAVGDVLLPEQGWV